MTAFPPLPGVSHRQLPTRTVEFHVACAGDPQAPLVLLLHGFPECWYSWRAQLVALSSRYFVVAPDLRGYGSSEKPSDGYDIVTLASDVPALIEALGRSTATVVGHDWGGAVAWGAASLHPEVVSHLVILDSPHPLVFRRALLTNPRQLLRSWYMFLFQVPGLFERWVRKDPERFMRRALFTAAGDRKPWTDEEIGLYAASLMEPRALECALAYYRSISRGMRSTDRLADPISAPTLLLWGDRDRALGTELVEPARRYVSGRFEFRIFEGAGHWLQQERPEEVIAAITDWVEHQ